MVYHANSLSALRCICLIYLPFYLCIFSVSRCIGRNSAALQQQYMMEDVSHSPLFLFNHCNLVVIARACLSQTKTISHSLCHMYCY
jgi:hypothetical protein